MTISNQTSRITYTGNGVVTDFPVPFYFRADSDLDVYAGAALQALGSTYTATGAGLSSGGTVVFATAPANAVSIVIYRDPPLTQTTDYIESDAFPAASHEAALDKACMIDQRTRNMVSRSLHLSDGDAGSINSLPAVDDRAGKYLYFDVDGQPAVAALTSGLTDAARLSVDNTFTADNTFTGNVKVESAGAYEDTSVNTGDQIVNFNHGSVAVPVTAARPSVGISRYEAITTDTQGGQNATLYISTIGDNVSSGVQAQANGFHSYATQLGSGDVAAIFGSAIQQGATGHTAYAGYFNTNALSSGSRGLCLELDVGNNTGLDHDYANLTPYPYTAAIHAQSVGSNRAAAGIWVGDSGATKAFDVGLAFTSGSVRSHSIVDNSSSTNSIYIAGSHTYGINLADGTFSTAAIIGPNFNIQGGAPTFMSGTAPPAGGGAHQAVRVSSTSDFGMFFGSGVPTVSAAKGSLYLRSDGSTTNDRMYVNTNGTTGWTAVITAS